MSTNNICFRGEIRKIICGYPLLSVAMLYWFCLFVLRFYGPVNPMGQFT